MWCLDSSSKNKMQRDFFLQILLQFKVDKAEIYVKFFTMLRCRVWTHWMVIQNFVPIAIDLVVELCSSYLVNGNGCCLVFECVVKVEGLHYHLGPS